MIPLSILVGSGQANPMAGRDHLCTALAFGGEEADDKGVQSKRRRHDHPQRGYSPTKKKEREKTSFLLASFMLVMHNPVRVERMHRVRASGER